MYLDPLGGGCPLRELTQHDIELYAQSVLFTLGTLADFKHYLPRILELDTELDGFGSLHELAPRFHSFGQFAEWPTAERDAVVSYLSQRWTATITWRRLGTWTEVGERVLAPLGALGAITADIAPALSQWLEFRTSEYAANLARVLEYDVYYLRIKFPEPHVWWTPESTAQWLDWLDSTRTYMTIAARAANGTRDERDALQRCVELLDERYALRST